MLEYWCAVPVGNRSIACLVCKAMTFLATVSPSLKMGLLTTMSPFLVFILYRVLMKCLFIVFCSHWARALCRASENLSVVVKVKKPWLHFDF